MSIRHYQTLSDIIILYHTISIFLIYLSIQPSIHQVHKIQQGGEERYVLDAIIGEGMKSTKCLGRTGGAPLGPPWGPQADVG